MRSIESSESSLPGNAPTVAWLESGLAIQISNFLVVLVVIVVVIIIVVVAVVAVVDYHTACCFCQLQKFFSLLGI